MLYQITISKHDFESLMAIKEAVDSRDAKNPYLIYKEVDDEDQITYHAEKLPDELEALAHNLDREVKKAIRLEARVRELSGWKEAKQEDYKQLSRSYDELAEKFRVCSSGSEALKQENEQLQEAVDTANHEQVALEEKLTEQITGLEEKVERLEAECADAERQRDDLERQLNYTRNKLGLANEQVQDLNRENYALTRFQEQVGRIATELWINTKARDIWGRLTKTWSLVKQLNDLELVKDVTDILNPKNK